MEPDAVARSIQALRADSATDHNLAATATELESDPEACAEVLSKPWREMSDKARQLVTFYLVKEVKVGSPALPIDEQFRIVWRCPRPTEEFGFGARIGQPSTRMSSHRECVSAHNLRAGGRIYWLSRYGNERGRTVSAVWDSEDTPGAICVLFDESRCDGTTATSTVSPRDRHCLLATPRPATSGLFRGVVESQDRHWTS